MQRIHDEYSVVWRRLPVVVGNDNHMLFVMFIQVMGVISTRRYPLVRAKEIYPKRTVNPNKKRGQNRRNILGR